MNALLAEINAKKSALGPVNADAGPSSTSGPKKYLRRAEVEAAQLEEERLRKEAAKEVQREKLRAEKEERAAKKAASNGNGNSVSIDLLDSFVVLDQ